MSILSLHHSCMGKSKLLLHRIKCDITIHIGNLDNTFIFDKKVI